MIVANNRQVLKAKSESKLILTANCDSSVAYIQLSQSGYCRHNTSIAELIVVDGKRLSKEKFSDLQRLETGKMAETMATL